MKKITSLLLLIAIFYSCKKGEKFETATSELTIQETKTNFLSLKDNDELNLLLKNLPNMSEQEYETWKIKNNNFESLYDRSKKLQYQIEEIGEDSQQIYKLMKKEEKHFELNKYGMVHIKSAGEVLSHFLNADGVIKIGDVMMRYEGGFFYFTKSEFGLLSSEEFSYDNNPKIQKVEINKLKPSVSLAKWVTYPFQYGDITNTSYLISNRYESNNRRFFVELIEEYSIRQIPNASGQPLPNTQGKFNMAYSLYLKFGHQRKSLGIWRSVSSSTYIQSLNSNAEYPTVFSELPIPGVAPYYNTILNNYNLPYGQNQYYNFSSIPSSLDPNTPNYNIYLPNQTFLINIATFSSFYLRSTGDGGQQWYDTYYTTP